MFLSLHIDDTVLVLMRCYWFNIILLNSILAKRIDCIVRHYFV